MNLDLAVIPDIGILSHFHRLPLLLTAARVPSRNITLPFVRISFTHSRLVGTVDRGSRLPAGRLVGLVVVEALGFFRSQRPATGARRLSARLSMKFK